MTPQSDHARSQGVSVDTGTREDWKRLGRQLEDRRLGMGYRYRPQFIQDRARLLGRDQLAEQTVKEIEKASASRRPGSWTPYKLGQIAPFYDTTADSMLAVVTGEADELAIVPAGPPELGPAPMTDEARAQAAWPWAMRIWKDVSAYQAAHEGDRDRIPGAALFRDPSLAAAWENTPLWMDLDQRIWALADLMRMADASRNQETRSDRSA